MLERFILSLLVLAQNHELNRNPDVLETVADHMRKAGELYDIEPSLTAYWLFRESSLRIGQVGDLGEVGYCQAHGMARRICEAAGHDPTTRSGGVYCFAIMMDMGRRYCGGQVRGAIWYATGKCRAARSVELKIIQRLKAWRRKWEQQKNN